MNACEATRTHRAPAKPHFSVGGEVVRSRALHAGSTHRARITPLEVIPRLRIRTRATRDSARRQNRPSRVHVPPLTRAFTPSASSELRPNEVAASRHHAAACVIVLRRFSVGSPSENRLALAACRTRFRVSPDRLHAAASICAPHRGTPPHLRCITGRVTEVLARMNAIFTLQARFALTRVDYLRYGSVRSRQFKF